MAAPSTGERRRAFRVVDLFEEAIAEYTGAPYVVAVDSCTNALFLSLLWSRRFATTRPACLLPRRTYVGVAHAAVNAGYRIEWSDEKWAGTYQVGVEMATTGLGWAYIVDAAKRFTGGMYQRDTLTCVSFQAGKILPVGRGGAILTDSAEAAAWLKRARFDGRTEGAACDAPDTITTPGYHCYMSPPDAARGLWLLTYLPEKNEDQVDTYEDLSTLEAFR